jgi:hypothetical protein
MREWNRRGLRTAQGGKPFTRQSVTVIMRNPRNAGLAVLPRRTDPSDRPELDNPPRKRKRLLPRRSPAAANGRPSSPRSSGGQ